MHISKQIYKLDIEQVRSGNFFYELTLFISSFPILSQNKIIVCISVYNIIIITCSFISISISNYPNPRSP